MKVLLLNPSWDRRVSRKGRRVNRAWPPLDLLNCAALLERENIQVSLIDARARWAAPEQIARAAMGFDKVFVTSSPLDRWQCPNLELDVFFKWLKPFKHDELYIMGVHGTHYPEIMLNKTQVRAVLSGEPEWTVLDLCRSKPLPEIMGLVYAGPNGVVHTAARPLGDLTGLALPAFHLLDLNSYDYELLGGRFVLLETARGCPYPCAFCMRDMYGGRAYREKTPMQVGREVQAAVEVAGAESGYFIDLEFTLNKKYAHEVCGQIMPYRSRWKWCCQTRADSVDRELLEAMKAAGCALIHFGVETGSERMMKQIDKRITLEGIERGVAMAKKAGLETACFFMLGFPGESEEEREKTFEFAKKLNPTYASFHVVSPYPGTPLHAGRDWGQPYPQTTAEGEEAARLERWEKAAYRRYYLRPGFMMSFLRALAEGRGLRQARLFLDMV